MKLVFIINGEDIPVDCTEWLTLKIVREWAVVDSHNTGRPAEEWELRDERGVRLDPNRTVGSYSFRDRDRLFLTLQVGIGGTTNKEAA